MLNNNCGEEHRYKTRSFLFFLKNTKPKKQKKVSNFSYLKMVLIRMKLIILLLLRNDSKRKNILP